MKQLFVAVAFVLFNVNCAAQTYQPEKYSENLIKTADGANIVYQSSTHSFSLKIAAKKIEVQQANYAIVDSFVLQYRIVPMPQKIDFSALGDDSKKENLTAYKDYEMDYIKKNLLKVKDVNEDDDFVTLNNSLFLFWSYDMPKSYKTVHYQCYLVTVCFDQMLVLNAPVDNELTTIQVRAFLEKIAKTLQLN